jgi:hypothetical protein
MDGASERTLGEDSVALEHPPEREAADDATSGGGPTRRSMRWLRAGWVPAVLSWVIPIAAWTTISAYYYGLVVARPSAGVPGSGDGVVYVWFFEWVEHALAHLQNPLLSDAMNAPTGVNAMWNGSVLLLSVPLAPLTAALGAVVVVNIVSIASPVLSAASAYFVFRRLTGRIASSLVVATFYGFGPFFVGQNGHLHLIACGPLLPLILLVGYRIFVTQRGSPLWAGVWLGLLAVGLLLVAEEMAVMATLVSAVAVLFLAIVYHRQIRSKSRYAAIAVAVAAGVAVVLAAYPLGYQFFGRLTMHGGLVVHRAALDLASFVRPSSLFYFRTSSDLAATKTYLVKGLENTGYLGVPLLVVIACALIWLAVKRDLFAVWWLPTTLVVWAFSLGTPIWLNGHRTRVPGLWSVFTHIRELKSLVVPRFSLLTALLVAFLIAWCFARLSGWAYAAATVAVAVALIPLIPVGQFGGITRIETPAFFTGPDVRRIPAGATVLILPQSTSAPRQTATRAMYWQVQAHMRFNIIGGYGIFTRDGEWSYYGEIPPFARTLDYAGATGVLPSPSRLPQLRESLTESGTSYIVITSQVPDPVAAAAAAQMLTGCKPEPSADVTLCAVPHG